MQFYRRRKHIPLVQPTTQLTSPPVVTLCLAAALRTSTSWCRATRGTWAPATWAPAPPSTLRLTASALVPSPSSAPTAKACPTPRTPDATPTQATGPSVSRTTGRFQVLCPRPGELLRPA
jgi:hypothetical protein